MKKLGMLALLLSAVMLTGIGCEPAKKKDDKKDGKMPATAPAGDAKAADPAPAAPAEPAPTTPADPDKK